MGDCGGGRKTRPVACVSAVVVAGEGGAHGKDNNLSGDGIGTVQWQVVAGNRCDAARRPAAERECRLSPCRPQWFTGDWSEVSYHKLLVL